MSVTLDHEGDCFQEDGVCDIVSIILEENIKEEGVDEDVFFISIGMSSVASQTDDEYFDSYDGTLCRVPIFYCGQPSPGTATTQCLIPHLADACVGTDPPPTCSSQHQGTDKPDATISPIAVPPSNSFGRVPVKTQIVKVTKKEAASHTLSRGVLPSKTIRKIKTETQPLPVPTHKKRGRKRKVLLGGGEKSNPSRHIPSAPPKTSGKRRRRKRQDDDFEYDLGVSEDETDQILKQEDDDVDEDWRTNKEESDDESEDGDEEEATKGSSPLPELGECGEEADNKTPMDGVTEYGVSSKEYGDSDGNDDDCDRKGDIISDSANNNGNEKSSRVLRVGINDLTPVKTNSQQQRKYAKTAKQKYRQEKVVKEDGSVVYQCLKCSEEFDLRALLNEHRKVHTSKARVYKCGHCDRVFSEARKYYSHLGLHKQIFKCQSCGRRYSHLANLKKHLSTHDAAPDQVCEVCGQQFLTPDLLQHHLEMQHRDDTVRQYKEECEHCGKKYVREEAYKQHVSGAPYKCSLCDESVGCETKLRTHVKSQHGRCVCEFCGKSFKKNSLINHIKILHGEACVPCPHCPRKFTFRSKMLAHLDAQHSQEKKYKCGQCSYTARTVNTLNLHHRRRHQDPALSPQYACNLCSRTFHLPSKLALHYRVHTGEKPFSCRACGKAFASKYNMTEHERCVHGERMLLQNPDGSSSVRVVKHRRAPRAPGRRCELCGLELPTSSAMVAHMKEQHNAQTLPSPPPEEDAAVATLEVQEGEIEAVVGEYEVSGEQCEAVEDGEDHDPLLVVATAPKVVSIPEYATHVKINGVEYQVLRQ